MIDAVYRAGGFLLFTVPGTVVVGAVAAVGAVAFASLVLRGGTTPFVVAGRVSIGAAVFIVGRLAIAAFHELPTAWRCRPAAAACAGRHQAAC